MVVEVPEVGLKEFMVGDEKSLSLTANMVCAMLFMEDLRQRPLKQ